MMQDTSYLTSAQAKSNFLFMLRELNLCSTSSYHSSIALPLCKGVR
jgi:hypothetical protein